MDLSAEFQGCDFNDKRLNNRLNLMIQSIVKNTKGSTPECMQTWSETQGAYRFYSNNNVTPKAILEPHVKNTLERMSQFDTVLLIQDTSEINAKNLQEPAFLNSKQQTGVLIHPTIAVTPDRLCLGVVDLNIWHRTELGIEKGDKIEDKESYKWLKSFQKVEKLKYDKSKRWVMIGDSECDIFEFFAVKKQVDFLVRSCQNRLLTNGKKLFEDLSESDVKLEIQFHHKDHGLVVQNVHAQVCEILPPKNNKELKQAEPVKVFAIACKQINHKEGAEPICWHLLTSVMPQSNEEIAEIVNWYLARWEIEIFFKILKSGCSVEKTLFEHVDRLANFLSVFAVVAWRILYMTKLGQACGDLDASLFFTELEWRVAHVLANKTNPPKEIPPLKEVLLNIAKIGGYLNRKSDNPPGPKIFWTGFAKLQQACNGVIISRQFDLNYV